MRRRYVCLSDEVRSVVLVSKPASRDKHIRARDKEVAIVLTGTVGDAAHRSMNDSRELQGANLDGPARSSSGPGVVKAAEEGCPPRTLRSHHTRTAARRGKTGPTHHCVAAARPQRDSRSTP